MPRELKNFPRSGRTRWDWDLILSGKVVELVKGEDFDEGRDVNTVRGGLIGTASTRGKKLRTHVTPEGNIVVECVGDIDRKETR